MRIPLWILTAAIFVLPALCQGVENCPWMNAATAGGVLGGNVTATVSRLKANTTASYNANAKSSAGPTSADPSANNYSTSGTDDVDCAFALQPGSVTAELRIQVRTMNNPKKDFPSYSGKCGAKATALKAIGNEGFACMTNGKGGKVGEQIVARVRDRVFVLRLTTNEPSANGTLEERTRRAADIVAGNLF